jgi:hypothetical protein
MVSFGSLTSVCKHTLDFDDGSSDVLHFARTELNDIFGCIKFFPFPDHGTRKRRCELVWR